MSAVLAEIGAGIGRDLETVQRGVELVQANPDAFRPDFLQWLTWNPHIWTAFVAKADEVRARGRKHYSARTIVEVLRHESVLRESPLGQWKINDHAAPNLARLYILFRPEAYGFFELRGDRVPA